MKLINGCEPGEYRNRNRWLPKQPWGGGEMQFSVYSDGTCFIEVFPDAPDTMIRVDGTNLDEIEARAFQRFQKYRDCPGHEFERGEYRNGCGTCKHCGLWQSKVFEPSTKCCICGVPTYYSCDTADNWYCEADKPKMPPELRPRWMVEFNEDDMAKITEHDIRDCIQGLAQSFGIAAGPEKGGEDAKAL